MAIIPFPIGPAIFSEGWRIENASRSGGTSLTGSDQVVVSPAGRWRAKASFHCAEDADYADVDGFLAALDGSANTFLIGPRDWRGRPWRSGPFGNIITPDLAARAAAEDPAFDADPLTTGRLQFALASPVGMNATTIAVNRTLGGILRRGQYLTIESRLHIIVNQPVDTGAAGGPIALQIRPWTRAAYPAGTPVSFDYPVCLMRLAPDAVTMLERTTSPLSDLSLDVVEAF